MDFIKVYTKVCKNNSKNREAGTLEVGLDFKVINSKDLMTRGKAFYGVWDSNRRTWIKDELSVAELVDEQILKVVDKHKSEGQEVMYGLMENYESGLWQRYVSYIKNMPDNWKPLDNNIYFANDELTRESYATHKLPYSLIEGPIPNYDGLMGVLYSPEERAKLEWAVGAILVGDSKHIQKFITLYGAPGSGKSTFLNIVQKLIEGYYITFNAKELVSNDSFATEVFKNNPLVAIQHDGDLSRIEDNSTLNSIISHEDIVINEKHRSRYSAKINCFLFLGTNKPVTISDSKSGLLRRLLDVSPSGEKIPKSEYNRLVKGIDFELGAIAFHCIKKYKSMGEDYYKDYKPREMMFETNAMYNFVFENAFIFENGEYFQLKQLYDMYQQYCIDSGENYPLRKKTFRAEMKVYFEEFHDVMRTEDGKQIRSVFKGFKSDIFDNTRTPDEEKPEESWLDIKHTTSLLDEQCKDQPAQYANDAGTPRNKWANCTTKLQDIDSKELHYISGFNINHIVIDFDIKDESGNKSLEKNLEAANKWPKTYAELSKSGNGIHLHYIWKGEDPTTLKRIYNTDVEVKVFVGDSSLRRKLTYCNTEPIAELSSGLEIDPKKGGANVVEKKTIESEKHLRTMIQKCMNKEFHGSTKPECDFIFTLLEEAYKSKMAYNVYDMAPAVLSFAAKSSNQRDYCISLVNKMKWASETEGPYVASSNEIIFYDVEVFPNLFLICFKAQGENEHVVSWVNPSPENVAELLNYKLVGFNNKRYDDHMLYARYLGYSNEALYALSKRIITKENSVRNGFREAYNIAYTDVYDFCSEKKSLKKWQLELGLHHQELEFDFDLPLPEEHWKDAIEYCSNDVRTTEQIFNIRKADWLARKILATLANGNPNMTTNQLTTKIVFGDVKKPALEYTNLEETFPGYEFVRGADNKMHNMYRETDVGMGGYVYAEPGMHFDVALLDIQSMHPASIINMNYFGEYTKNYSDLKDARVAIKQGDYEKARTMLDGKLAPYLEDTTSADDLSHALKIALNSAYGLTSASFENAMRDKRNVNNIVALRGALFMRTLQDEVQQRGYRVAHIKTDSIKIPNATPEIIEFCKGFAEEYGYIFEHEATFEKMCLVNNAVYIAKYKWAQKTNKIGTWTATGAQFAEPYVFKTLFSKEPIIFSDYVQNKSVTSPAVMYLDFNEEDEESHNYVHVGRAGAFVPVVEGVNGGVLLRKKDDIYHAVTGTKGHRWKEAQVVKTLGQEDEVSLLYFQHLLDAAIVSISQYGPIEDFVDDYRNDSRHLLDAPIGFDEMPLPTPIAKVTQIKGE